MTNLVKTGKKIHPIQALFDHFGIVEVSPEDSLSFTSTDGMLEVNVKRASGKTENIKKFVGGGFEELTTFDPDHMNRENRNILIKKLHANGGTEQSLAKKFGLSQSMISRIVNS